MTKDIETVTFPKCSKCKEVIQNPHEGYIVVGDIYTAELDADGEPHQGLVGASFPTPSEDYAITLREQDLAYKFTYDDVHRHCFCQGCMLEILKIPHRPIPRPGLRGGGDAVDDAYEKMRKNTAGRSPIEFDED